MYMYNYIGYSAKKLCNMAEYFYEPVLCFQAFRQEKIGTDE